MFKKVVLLCGIIMLISGCAGLGDYDIDLPGNYSILRTSGDQITIAPQNEIGWGENIVPAKVIEVGWNKKYIIAKQKKVDNDEVFYWILNVETGNAEKFLNSSDFEEKIKDYEIEIEMKKVEDLR